jgi:hypothetical protein
VLIGTREISISFGPSILKSDDTYQPYAVGFVDSNGKLVTRNQVITIRKRVWCWEITMEDRD